MLDEFSNKIDIKLFFLFFQSPLTRKPIQLDDLKNENKKLKTKLDLAKLEKIDLTEEVDNQEKYIENLKNELIAKKEEIEDLKKNRFASPQANKQTRGNKTNREFVNIFI